MPSPHTPTADTAPPPWSQPAPSVLAGLGVNPRQGLDRQEARRRLRRFGPNRLRPPRHRSAWQVLLAQFKSLMMLLLALAALLAFGLGQTVDGAAILAVLGLNVAIGFTVELRGVRSMEALYRLTRLKVRVRRGGHVKQIATEQLVPGDLVLLEGGDKVGADLRLLEAANLQVDESALTGESLPVTKGIEPVPADSPLAERSTMLYSGTHLVQGSGEAVVVATGLATELGRIATLVTQIPDKATPLEQKLALLGQKLIWLTLALAALLALAGIWVGREPVAMLKIAIALAVAAVPEGLPVVATIALARGMWRMARQNALINRLAAVETLGATAVICTDKTGTLTENRLSLARLLLASGEQAELAEAGFEGTGQDSPQLRQALELAVLCNNASLDEGGLGDPLEVALLAAGRQAGLEREALLRRWPELREEAFSTDSRMMASFHQGPDGIRVAVKGAPEAVLAACAFEGSGDQAEPMVDARRQHWLAQNQRLAKQGLRVLALAEGRAANIEAEPYQGLSLLALVGLMDPPRQDVALALAQCRAAGIRVVMVTGDQAATAAHVARQLGLDGDQPLVVAQGKALRPLDEMSEPDKVAALATSVFARVEPAQKLRLVALHQEAGAVVAMTGDGVNDAPALKQADIGIAMGQRGTQVAREAAAMVLKDDAFATLVLAVRQGRIIFDNIRSFVLYLLSCNISELMVVALATLADAPLPLLPLQILYLNLVTDVFPALALGVGPGAPGVMERPPRPRAEAVIDGRHWLAILGYGSSITFAVLGAFALALGPLALAPAAAVTIAFLTLALAQLWHLFNMRQPGSSWRHNAIVRNPYAWAALALCLVLLWLALYLPPLAALLHLEPPGLTGWALVLSASLLPLLLGQSLKALNLTQRKHP
ncbi:cation-transporting P-type ATPase [Gallaecimonas kandeliae]|uniref:cation-translocating P-type ATPase n=1 Tax=Gallaecimonas kandeliae TaxID=3029055 RepID=UPI002649118E|nr:cation-transporting P-type ATPase [Gallaecimonas kandeliae]WKE66497.1 cation-transporting P-type ATPase [Gallaecimonas kandeliae]